MNTAVLFIVIVLTVLLVVAMSFYFILNSIIEPVYVFLFGKPIYVHLYPFPKELDINEQAVLERHFSFYRNLSEQRKRYFRHRINTFVDNYMFVGRGGVEVTPEMKVKIAATSVMLTFGMREYISDLFEVIIVYPDVFESLNGDYHKGEFNPAAKAIVFSWKHFQEGIDYDNDNLNLGLHEFAHALHFCAVSKKREGASLAIYKDMFEEIRVFSSKSNNRDKIMNSGYLRDYAFTNQHEFMAVVFENFFESPQEFRQKLPELYEMIRKMINYREN